MKLIGITQRLEIIKEYNEVREQLDVKWGELLLSSGYMPVVLTSNIEIEDLLSNMSLHGIILTGGNDLSSKSGIMIDKRRDLFEKNILRVSIQRRLPILGICRGMQVIGEFFGAQIEEVNHHIGVRHNIHILPNTELYHYIKKDRICVNSYHRYSIKNIDQNELTVLATSEDGEIEAVKHKKYPIMAQMWHPERELPFKEWDQIIIKRLFL